MTTLNARLTRRAFLGGAAAFGAAAMVSPKNAFADPTSADVQAQADEARQKLNSMREQLGAASANYNQAVQEHDEAVSKMDECQTKIDDNNAQIDKLQDKLSKRARNMYRDGQTTFLDVILGSNSFDDFAKNWDTLTSLNEKDSEMVEQTKNLRADNEAQKQEYANQADIAQQKVEEADAAQKQAEELVQQYQNEVDSLDSQVAELLAEEEAAAQKAAEEAAQAMSDKAQKGAREEQKAMAFQTWKKAQAALDVAKKSFDRVQKLFENDVVSAQKRDEAEANYKAMLATEQAAKAQYEMAKNGAEKEDKLAAEAQVNRARGAVEEVSSYIKETFLISPISGEISERYPKVGELVGTGSPVMNVLDLEDMWVVFNVREDLLGDLKMGTVFTGYIPALNNKEVQLKVTHMKNMGTYAAWRATKTTGQYDAKTFEVKAVPMEKVEVIGNKRLRNRGRAAGVRDFEEIVLQDFPQARHVKCFSGRDAGGNYAPGHVSVVVEGCDLDSTRVTDDLCRRIYRALSQQCDCVLVEEERLHVVGSTVITVNSTVTVEMEDPNQGAATQQAVARRLEELINLRWREQDIGSQLRIAQVWQTVRDTPNVRLVRSILLEGRFDQAGVQKVVALEDNDAFPYATVKSGLHLVQVE